MLDRTFSLNTVKRTDVLRTRFNKGTEAVRIVPYWKRGNVKIKNELHDGIEPRDSRF